MFSQERLPSLLLIEEEEEYISQTSHETSSLTSTSYKLYKSEESFRTDEADDKIRYYKICIKEYEETQASFYLYSKSDSSTGDSEGSDNESDISSGDEADILSSENRKQWQYTHRKELDDSNTVKYLPSTNCDGLLEKIRAAIYLSLDELWDIPKRSNTKAQVHAELLALKAKLVSQNYSDTESVLSTIEEDCDSFSAELWDNVNQVAIDILTLEGYQIKAHSETLSEDVLIAKIHDIHCVRIQSKTKLTKNILLKAKKLLVIGCFCANTSQIDLKTATSQKITVFNSSFDYSRSIAELVITKIIMLSRHLSNRNIEIHQGIQNKALVECYEICRKTLGIIGYGHIGSQLSILAESMGIVVYFYDVFRIMLLETAKQVNNLEELLKQSDFVTIYVPKTNKTKNLISVAINILSDDINEYDNDGLRICKNLILTSHIKKVQKLIGVEVATAIFKYINLKLSIGAIN
ncbi:56_t:CDS:10 [Scutellospora calospora]|uniref:56_t:CDS:1 n=1 Tax=Scutellospora calospora TaxID=85575 RepID=A0ACA9K1F8_9GLOM|nr:56_t:CDS:10 [Scutellospora calospora]